MPSCYVKYIDASAYAVGLRLTILQKKGRSAPRPCVDLIIIIIIIIRM